MRTDQEKKEFKEKMRSLVKEVKMPPYDICPNCGQHVIRLMDNPIHNLMGMMGTRWCNVEPNIGMNQMASVQE